MTAKALARRTAGLTTRLGAGAPTAIPVYPVGGAKDRFGSFTLLEVHTERARARPSPYSTPTPQIKPSRPIAGLMTMKRIWPLSGVVISYVTPP